MKDRFVLVCAISCWLMSFSAAASWSPKAMSWAEQINQKPIAYLGETATVLGQIKADLEKAANLKGDSNFSSATIPSSYFVSGNESALLYTQRYVPVRVQEVRRAPLIVVLPGLFSSLRDATTLRLARDFSKRLYHVLVLGNPWGTVYLGNNPVVSKDEFSAEAESTLTALRWAIAQIGANNITQVQLVGESYGAFLGAVTLAKDSQSATPLLSGPVTLISPPIDLLHGMNIFDSQINSTQAYYSAYCAGLETKAAIVADLLDSHAESDLSLKTEDCVEPLVANSFQGWLIDAAQAVNANHPTDASVQDPTWQKNLRFNSFFREFEPNVYSALQGRESSLSYWLSQVSTDKIPQVRVISAADDFLNVGLNWNSLPTINKNNLLLLTNGGHMGFEAWPEFQTLLDSEF